MSSAALPEQGRLPENITHFARALRRAGLPVGPGHIADAIRAVAAVGFAEREAAASIARDGQRCAKPHRHREEMNQL